MLLKLINSSLVCTNLIKLVQYHLKLHIQEAGIKLTRVSAVSYYSLNYESRCLPTLSNVDYPISQKITIKQK